MKRTNLDQKGITLIALVVTIVILLILAGVGITSITGEKEIIKESRNAKELAEKAALEEQIEAAILIAKQKHRNPALDDVIDEIKNSKIITNHEQVNRETGAVTTDLGYVIEGKLDDYIGKDIASTTKPTTVVEAIKYGNILDEKDLTTITDKYENEIVVPEGFKIADDSAEDVTGGVVIEDVSNKETKGSQFVWIPVGEVKCEEGTKKIGLNRYIFDDNGVPTEQNNNEIESYYQELVSSNKGNTVAKSIEDFKTSASINSGYYLGRYEAGDRDAKEARKLNASVELPMVCQEGKYVYNNIKQPDAAKLSREMYLEDKKFVSDLINSYAWDTAIVFIQKFSGDSDYALQNPLQTTNALTGQATDGKNKDVRCNIFDMAGNCSEWTTESSSYTDHPTVYRGGETYPNDSYTSLRHWGIATGADRYSFF